MLIQQYAAALTKGGSFIQDPRAVFSASGERRFSHPLDCDWALAMHYLINDSPAVRAHAATAGLKESHLLAYYVYSDATEANNKQKIHPVQVCHAHSDAKTTHALLADGGSVVAYIPPAHKPLHATAQRHTEESCMLRARCFAVVSWDVFPGEGRMSTL